MVLLVVLVAGTGPVEYHTLAPSSQSTQTVGPQGLQYPKLTDLGGIEIHGTLIMIDMFLPYLEALFRW